MRGVPILATIALVPLILTPHLLLYYDVTPKIAILLLGVALMLLFGQIDLDSIWKQDISRWFLYIVAFQWIWFGFASALSTNPAISLNGSTWRRLGFFTQTGVLAFALLCLAWLLENPANLRLLLRVIAAAGLLISIYTIAQYFGIDPLLPAAGYHSGEGPFTIVRPPGTLGHADYLAAWLLFAVFCNPRWMFPIVCFALLLTGTRSALLGLAAGLILLFLLGYRGGTAKQRFGAVAFCAVLAVFCLSPAGAKIRARVHWSLDDPAGAPASCSGRIRCLSSRVIPWLGWVLKHSARNSRYTNRWNWPALTLTSITSRHTIFSSDFAAGQGLPAALAFLGLCCLAAWVGIRANSEVAHRLLAALAALFIAHVFVVLTMPTELAFYLLIVMLISLGPRGTSKSSGQYRPYMSLPRYAISIILLVFAVRSVTADYLLARAHQRIIAGNIMGGAIAYKASLYWQPAGAGADLSYSRQAANLASRSVPFKVRLDAFQQALESGIRATEQSEQRQNAWFNLAESSRQRMTQRAQSAVFATRSRGRPTGSNRIGFSPSCWKPNTARGKRWRKRKPPSREMEGGTPKSYKHGCAFGALIRTPEFTILLRIPELNRT